MTDQTSKERLSPEKLAEFRELVEFGSHLGVGGGNPASDNRKHCPEKARGEPVTKVCKWTEADTIELLYLTDCGHEYHRDPSLDLYDFCRWCGGMVEVVSAENGTALP